MMRKFPATPESGITSRGASWVRPSAWSRKESSSSRTASRIGRSSATSRSVRISATGAGVYGLPAGRPFRRGQPRRNTARTTCPRMSGFLRSRRSEYGSHSGPKGTPMRTGCPAFSTISRSLGRTPWSIWNS